MAQIPAFQVDGKFDYGARAAVLQRRADRSRNRGLFTAT
jgi:hypothetical protein